MKNSNSKALGALIFRIATLAFAVFGIAYHMLLNKMLTTGFMVKHNLAYFTLQTNIFIALIFLILVVKTIVDYCKTKQLKIANINYSVHLACVFYITITMLVYWLVLVPLTGFPKNSVLLIDSMLLHTVTPLFAIIDFIVFFKHAQVKYKDVFKWLIYPVTYWISTIILSRIITEPYYTYKMGGEIIELMYPYPFLDPNVVGLGGVIGIVIGLAALFLLFGTLYIYIDNRIKIKK